MPSPDIIVQTVATARRLGRAGAVAGVLLLSALVLKCGTPTGPPLPLPPLDPELVAEGREIFRFDTFGDETFWADTARLHEVITQAVSPELALQVGLKVDADALPQAVKDAILAGEVDLTSPATTVTLLKLNAVVGVMGTVETVEGRDTLVRVGITCALCHSTVDNSFTEGIGGRLDGWPNRDLNVGAIIALSPAITPAQKEVYNSWGPGMYDARFSIDGLNIPVVMPPALGLRGVSREIYTGDDTLSYWNAYVAVTQMHGRGRFVDPRLGISVVHSPDLVTSKLPALREYQHSLETPAADAGAVDEAASQRGRAVFNGVAQCATCHIPTESFTDVNRGVLHQPAAVGQDPAYAARSITKQYRTTPLRLVFRPPFTQGPYFHDGSAATLDAVVDHYVALLGLSLTAQQKTDLVEYLKTL